MKEQRFRYLWLALPLLVGIWLVWPKSTKDTAGDPSQPASSRAGSNSGSGTVSSPTGSDKTHRPRARELSVTQQTRARIDRVLADDAISTKEAAVMLHDLVVNASLPLDDRLEALEHGLNLDFAPFSNLAETPDLPAELADAFLNAVINQNDAPALQIRAYLALMNHPDPDVSKSATDMLAFLVEDDQRTADPATLVQLGKKKLAEISKDSR